MAILCLHLVCAAIQSWGLILMVKATRLSDAIDRGDHAEVRRLLGRRL